MRYFFCPQQSPVGQQESLPWQQLMLQQLPGWQHFAAFVQQFAPLMASADREMTDIAKKARILDFMGISSQTEKWSLTRLRRSSGTQREF